MCDMANMDDWGESGKRAGLGEWRGGEVVVRRKRAGSRNVNLLGERGKR